MTTKYAHAGQAIHTRISENGEEILAEDIEVKGAKFWAGTTMKTVIDVTCNLVKGRTLPSGSEARKDIPIASGCLDYFPAALAEIARLSKYGNDKHNPGEELHHARAKSSDHADCIVRHLMERGEMDPSGFSHTVMVAWRALALLQEELEANGAPLARGARLGTEEATDAPGTLTPLRKSP